MQLSFEAEGTLKLKSIFVTELQKEHQVTSHRMH